MPHDKRGPELTAEMIVAVPCVVKEVQQGEDYCNVTLATLYPMYPGDQKTGMVLNTRQVLRVDDEPETPAAPPEPEYRCHFRG